jgi:hypothetical protein
MLAITATVIGGHADIGGHAERRDIGPVKPRLPEE